MSSKTFPPSSEQEMMIVNNNMNNTTSSEDTTTNTTTTPTTDNEEKIEEDIANKNQTKKKPRTVSIQVDKFDSKEYDDDNDEKDIENPLPPSIAKKEEEEEKTSESDDHFNKNQPLPSMIVQLKGTKAPKETLEAVYKAGQYKAALPLHLLMIQAFMAGVYIAMAGHLYLAVGGGILGAALFPTGLIAVVLTSAELFTGDALVFVASVLGQRVTFSRLCRNWTVAWIMNFAGCIFWAGLLAYASDSLEDLGVTDLAVKVAEKKADQPWMNIFIKGIGANFMVCIGVWQATCAEEVAGKCIAIWFPIAAFVMMGFDHCIANQFLIPVGMMYGADVSVVDLLFKALLPATIGNAIGGGLLVGAVYWYVYDSMASTKALSTRIRRALSIPPHQKRRSE